VNAGSLLLLSQTVKLSGWSHGPSCALSHDRAHVLSPDHDSSPLMTRHMASPYLLIYPLVITQPHFWLDATLSFSSSDSCRFAPAILLTGPHTHSSFLYLSLSLPSMYKHGLCVLICAHPGSYISPQSIVLYFLSLNNNRLLCPQSPVRGYLLCPHLARRSLLSFITSGSLLSGLQKSAPVQYHLDAPLICLSTRRLEDGP